LHVRTPKQIARGLKEGDCDWFLREVWRKEESSMKHQAAQWVRKAEQDMTGARALARERDG
jgi:hypothetical protein